MEYGPREGDTPKTLLLWCYANLSMAHAAVEKRAKSYSAIHYSIRHRMFREFQDGSASIRALVEDERLKFRAPKACCYCGSTRNLSIDHLFPTASGGPNVGENLVQACRSCNSSKGAKDLLVWYKDEGRFPPLLILRRYLKIAIARCNDLKSFQKEISRRQALPFDPSAVPIVFPSPSELRLWVTSKLRAPRAAKGSKTSNSTGKRRSRAG